MTGAKRVKGGSATRLGPGQSWRVTQYLTGGIWVIVPYMRVWIRLRISMLRDKPKSATCMETQSTVMCAICASRSGDSKKHPSNTT